jgi:Ca2+-binding EF-hand superfamily protein
MDPSFLGAQASEKLKNHLLATDLSIFDFFKQADPNNTGKISSLTFRHLLLKLNAGLLSGEINQIMDLAFVDTTGLVDWPAFIDRLHLRFF